MEEDYVAVIRPVKAGSEPPAAGRPHLASVACHGREPNAASGRRKRAPGDRRGRILNRRPLGPQPEDTGAL
jgi:hypothetical protein